MSDELEFISDGDGLAVIGDPVAVERFLTTAGVASRDLALQQRLGTAASMGAATANASSHIAENAGRWVKLTKDSAEAMKVSQLMKGSTDGVSRAIATTSKGKITKILEFANSGSVGSILTNPAILTGAAGIMAQLAMQQTMDEITDYLAKIDEKVDDILRAQKDAALAEMIGAGFMIDEALILREHTGRVSDVTWSKVQASGATVASTQGYALRQLDALAVKLERKQSVGDLADVTRGAEQTVEDWLAVLSRCFQLQDALAVLELDRVLDGEPHELDRHRIGLKAARQKRRDEIARTTEHLLGRIAAIAGSANEKTLLHPINSGHVVRSGNEVATDVIVFHDRLGIETSHELVDKKAWKAAVAEARARATEASADGLDTARRFGAQTFDNAKSTADQLGERITKRIKWGRGKASATEDSSDSAD